MIYSASLVEQTEDKLNGYYPIKTREDLDKVVAQVDSSNRIIIRQDLLKCILRQLALLIIYTMSIW